MPDFDMAQEANAPAPLDPKVVGKLEARSRRDYWKATAQVEQSWARPQTISRDPLTSFTMAELPELTPEEEALLANGVEGENHPGYTPVGRNFDWKGEGGRGDKTMVTEEFKSIHNVLAKKLRSGELTPERLGEWYAKDPIGKRYNAYRKKLESKFNDPGSGAEFEMAPIVKLSPEEKARRADNKMANFEQLRLNGLTGQAMMDNSPFSAEATRQMVPNGVPTSGPYSRTPNPTVADMADSSGRWPRGAYRK